MFISENQNRIRIEIIKCSRNGVHEVQVPNQVQKNKVSSNWIVVPYFWIKISRERWLVQYFSMGLMFFLLQFAYFKELLKWATTLQIIKNHRAHLMNLELMVGFENCRKDCGNGLSNYLNARSVVRNNNINHSEMFDSKKSRFNMDIKDYSDDCKCYMHRLLSRFTSNMNTNCCYEDEQLFNGQQMKGIDGDSSVHIKCNDILGYYGT